MKALLSILDSSFFPTVVVSSFLGYLTYKQTRAGQRDTTQMQEKAQAITETQNAMQAYKDLYDTEHARRLEAEAEAKECRLLVRADFEKAVRSMGIVSSDPDYKPKSE